MLLEIAKRLDDWAIEQSFANRAEGLLGLRPCTIKVLGQSALLEARFPLTLAATNDVDVYADYENTMRQEFERLLAIEGRYLDPLGAEIWMPPETRYSELYAGRFVKLFLAEPEAVLVSKGVKAPVKNSSLLTEYLATGASDRFLALASKYSLDLEQFL